MNSSRSPNFEWARLTLTIPRIAEVMYKIVERTNYILDKLSIEFTQQAFTHAYGIFHCMRQYSVTIKCAANCDVNILNILEKCIWLMRGQIAFFDTRKIHVYIIVLGTECVWFKYAKENSNKVRE